MTNYKQLCSELIDELEGWIAYGYEIDIDKAHALIDRARAELAKPEPEPPTDEDLLDLDQLRDRWNAQADAFNTWDELGIDEIVWWAQRQALARWGNHPGSPDSPLQPIPPESPKADPYLENCSKAVIDRARQIDEMLAVNVYGPGPESDTCVSSWFTSKLIANLEERISIIEELQEEIRSLRASYLRLANAVAHIAPDRAKFFADLNPDSND